jgi:uroporphyrin-III C-methyltransferase/precorrin-2 dehydrogenase/sirohydrochlorin ferrochelatase
VRLLSTSGHGYSDRPFLADDSVDYFPAFLDLRGRSCLVVGGGNVALRKVRLLTAAGARITIVAPEINDALIETAANNGHHIVEREFRPSDVLRRWLVVSATGDPALERSVYRFASDAGIFCNGVDDIANCSYITPAIVDRGPVVVAISSGGAAPVLARKLRAQIELLLPKGLETLAILARDWRGRVQSRLDDLLSRRRFWESVFDGSAGSYAIAGDIPAAEAQMTELLDNSTAEQAGEAWLVGAGPGDPGLLTIRALQIMQTADVILHDRLVSKAVLELARRDADLISVGKTPGCKANSQEEINELLVELVRSGKRVCRLKGGDPFIFGRGGEEAEALASAGLGHQVVPGITAAAGCAAYSGIPLTHRDLSQSVAFVTAHGKNSVDDLDWTALARDRQTLAFYMAVQRFPDVMNNLIANGRSADTPIAIIEKGTTPEQRVIRGTLGQLTLLAEAHRVAPPAMLVVGEVAALGGEDQNRMPLSAQYYAKPDIRIAQKG